MSGAQWFGLVALASLFGAFAFWVYLRQEVRVSGRGVLAALRTCTLALLLLLLVNPSVPGGAAARHEARTWVAVDASLSMAAAPDGEPSPWDRAVERARELGAAGALVAAFGEDIRFVAEDPGLLERRPEALGSELGPVLERALEAGAREVVVLSDMRVADAVAVRAVIEQGGLPVRFEDVGGDPMNAGLASLDLPAAVRGGERVAGEVTVYGSEAAAGRTATVEVREEERLLHTGEVTLPGPGLVVRVELDLPPPAVRGAARYEARVRLPGDALEDDDVRVAYVAVDPEEGLLVTVDLNPGWELRFLMPLLEQVTGLDSRGYLRVGPEDFIATGGGAGEGVVEVAEVRRVLEGAELVVLHGLRGDDPEWLMEVARSGRRVLLVPSDAQAAQAGGVSTGSPQLGEWYASAEVPPSPLAADLSGASWQGLPPLSGLLPANRAAVGDVPLRVQLRGSGPAEPALLLVRGSSGRRAVVLASGFWRWGFRPGEPRNAYRRLWAGVAGWLLADAVVASGPAVRPIQRVVPRGAPVEWAVRGEEGGELPLFLTLGDSIVLDTTLAVPESGLVRTGPLPPGRYAYRSSGPNGGEVSGSFDVEAYTDELRHPPVPDLFDATPEQAVAGSGRGGTRPLRTHPGPYMLLLGLICAEWIGRRRKGLR